MERLSSLLNNVKERLNNPFLFSFLLSWLIVNWRISVALIWGLDESQKGSLIGFIEENFNKREGLVYPFVAAVGYTLLFPIFRNLIVAFQNWNFVWGERWHIHILRSSKVEMSRYLKLRESVLEKQSLLERFYKEETSRIQNISSLENLIGDQRLQLNTQQAELADFKDQLDNLARIDIVQGVWQRKVEGPLRSIDELIEITSHNVYQIKDGSTRHLKYAIQHFRYQKREKVIQFCLFDMQKGKPIFDSFNHLQVMPGNSLEGREYSTGSDATVIYTKQNVIETTIG